MLAHRFLILLVIGTLFLSACVTTTPTSESAMEKPTEVMAETNDDMQENPKESMEEPTEVMQEPTEVMQEPTSEGMKEDDKEQMEATPEPTEEVQAVMVPDWFTVSLVDVNTNERFKIEDFKGKVILVETLAMWCSTCRSQQQQVVVLHEQLGDRDDFVSLGLDIDPNEIAEDLVTYTQNNGFDWTYAVSPPKVSNEIAELYGNQFLNPPSAPMFIIDRHGNVHLLRFGVKSAEELHEALQPFLDEAM